MSGVQHRAVKPGDDGMRLDRWFRKYFAGLTHSRLDNLLRLGGIRLDGTLAKASDRVQTGQQVRV
ncbi:MAG: RluA family pseudouridine synthase, partial [Pseudomonadota bacterium]|nr:RluA family pseudouridine synthase [Pseudomonadota bacterium]